LAASDPGVDHPQIRQDDAVRAKNRVDRTRFLSRVSAETMVSDAKEYISETINDPEAFYDPKIWDTPGFALVLSWLAQKWQRKCRMLAARGNRNPEQYLTKEEQQTCLDSAAAELIRELRQQRPLS
jgi:hypothetical protein